jgi:hypothetical protein
MSGLLRRIKRSRTAGAGEPPADEQAATPEGASTTAETAPAGDEAKTTQLPVTTPPALAADPDRPAGLDERATAAQPPTGRRGRLRRRLRYLRRARELMLRDLGGLVYEVHRTGGGDFGAHRGVLDGKLERLVILDSESGAIEQALGAPRSETVVFEPGVGGTCDVCGELYASAARFCSRCGTPTDPAAREKPAPPAEPRRVPPMPQPPGTAATAVGAASTGADEPRSAEPTAADAGKPGEEAKAAGDDTRADAPPAAAGDNTPADTPPAAAGDDTRADPPPATAADDTPTDAPPATAADETPTDAPPAAAGDETRADAARDNTPADAPPAPAAAEEPRPDDATQELKPGADEPPDAGRNPFENISNGRAEDSGKPPELSSGDPLAAPETRK